MGVRGVLAACVCLGASLAAAADPASSSLVAPRSLSFDDRVRAQEAIERVYYSHQLGTAKPFEQAVPRSVLEAKVKKYLEESAALDTYWKTPVTDLMLDRELERMASGTRMPERLNELYAALGNDAFLIKECLARATLVDRLAHNFYAFDTSIHAEAKRRAEAIHQSLVAHTLDPSKDLLGRTLVEWKVADRQPSATTNAMATFGVTAEDLRARRARLPARVGEASSVRETRETFTTSVVLTESSTSFRVANFTVHKTAWDAWWETVRPSLRSDSIATVAAERRTLPPPKEAKPLGGNTGPGLLPSTCGGDDHWDNGILDDLPRAREFHSTVWTGTLMIAWGGAGGDYMNTGDRYDPATDTWSRTSTVNAPSPRAFHTAVWSGEVMIVWGGGGYPYANDGGRYDPVADRWAPTSRTGAPSPRTDHTAVWTGSVMIVWGGFDVTGDYLQTGGRYDPATDTWTATSLTNASPAAEAHTAIWTGNRMIVWGGLGNARGRYDPTTDTWTGMSTTGAPSGRYQHTAVWTGSTMLVWGGSLLAFYPSDVVANTGARYDVAADVWTPISTTNAPTARSAHGAVWTGNAMVVWGGYTGDPYPDDLDTGGRYDPTNDSWTPTATLGAPAPRAWHGTIWTGTQMIVWGGENNATRFNTGGRYDPSHDVWTPTSTSGTPEARTGASAVWTGAAMIVWGGSTGYGSTGSGGRYDPTTDSWAPTSTSGAPSARYGQTAVWTGSRMIVWGGIDETGYNLQSGGRYDPTTDTWSPTSTPEAPAPRGRHTAVWTGTRMIIWGGNGAGFLSTGAQYDPLFDTWTPTSISGAPDGRMDHTAAWMGSRMLVWGGSAGNVLMRSGGLYDPVSDRWSPVSTAGAPAGVTGNTLVSTGSSALVWGGGDSTGVVGTGARYNVDTNTWTPMSSAGAPSARQFYSAVWTGTEMLVVGGDELATYPNTTGGRYDPATDTWVALPTAGAPSPRREMSAVWTGTAMIVWGGFGQEGTLDTGGRYFLGSTVDNDGDGFSECQGDCNDGNAAVYPGAPEICDGLNDNCSDPLWPAVPPGEANADGDAFLLCQGDCDDNRASAYPGAPELCNGLDDDCDGVVDNNADASCDDGNPCTDDACHDGRCDHVGNSAQCDDGDPCTGDDTCANGSCHGAPLDGGTCSDSNACTINDTCHAGICAGAPRTCNDGNACTDDSCDPATGCVFRPRAHPCDDGNPCTDDSCDPVKGCLFTNNNTRSCDDGNLCTVNDRCVAGACVPGTPRNCVDGNPCTDDSCQPLVGCVFTPNTAPCDDHRVCTIDDRCSHGSCAGTPTFGTPCDDGNRCTVGDTCAGTTCGPGAPLDCDDHNVCTADSCSPTLGCQHSSAPADQCHDGNLCTIDGCDPVVGCTYTAIPEGGACDDGDLCTSGETCHGGTCRGGAPVDCDDHNVCTSDACFSWLGCVHDPSPGQGCDDGNPCTVDGCDPALGCVFVPAVGLPCNDFFSCTVDDRCNQDGFCEGHSVCDDGNPCTDDYADENGNCACSHFPGNDGGECTDGNACTSGDACAGGSCQPGAALDCDDHNLCTDDSCDPAKGCVHSNNANPCTDGNACTDGDTCAGGACRPGAALDCDDGNPCTIDLCDPTTGCVPTAAPQGTPCDDGNACDGVESCDGYGSCISHDPPQCDDGNPCTDDSCDPAKGCVHVATAEGTSCDDGNACTTQDACDGNGVCISVIPLDCDDGNSCTDDSCDPAIGCVHVNNAAPCNDGNACTTGDICGGGSCRAGAPVVCHDGNVCTDDACDPARGCVFTNNSAACDDGNACTRTDVCVAGACTGTSPVVCAPIDQCHVAGVCDPGSGACSSPAKPDGTACDDGSLCTTGDACVGGTCTPSFSGLNEPNPRTTGYYQRLCKGPHSGDQLTDADAVCVAGVARTFAAFHTVADMCAELQPSQPNNDPCDRTDDDLLALALNICRARVCTLQGLDSQCGSNADAGQSLAESDAILSSPSRDAGTCAHAKCLDEEINTGRALEMNSLTLGRDSSGVRLSWKVPYLDDGTSHPSKYHVWRRMAGSLSAFSKLATTEDTTYRDGDSGSFEYEVTAVMN